MFRLQKYSTNPNVKSKMDVPLVNSNIRIWCGFKGYRRSSSTFNPLVGLDGLSAFSGRSCNYSHHGVLSYKAVMVC